MGTHVYLWRIHFNIWQNQYNIVKFKKKNDICITDSLCCTAKTNTVNELYCNKNYLKKKKRYCASNAGAMGSIPSQGIKIPHASWCGKK